MNIMNKEFIIISLASVALAAATLAQSIADEPQN